MPVTLAMSSAEMCIRDSLRGADHLIVLENGELVESGTHKELIDKRGVYFKLLQLQSKALAMRGVGD